MIINYKNPKKYFGDITIGTVFKYKEYIYFKVKDHCRSDTRNIPFNAIRLSTSKCEPRLLWINMDKEVQSFEKAELVLR